eukprot:Awhi_evm1s6967
MSNNNKKEQEQLEESSPPKPWFQVVDGYCWDEMEYDCNNLLLTMHSTLQTLRENTRTFKVSDFDHLDALKELFNLKLICYICRCYDKYSNTIDAGGSSSGCSVGEDNHDSVEFNDKNKYNNNNSADDNDNKISKNIENSDDDSDNHYIISDNDNKNVCNSLPSSFSIPVTVLNNFRELKLSILKTTDILNARASAPSRFQSTIYRDLSRQQDVRAKYNDKCNDIDIDNDDENNININDNNSNNSRNINYGTKENGRNNQKDIENSIHVNDDGDHDNDVNEVDDDLQIEHFLHKSLGEMD